MDVIIHISTLVRFCWYNWHHMYKKWQFPTISYTTQTQGWEVLRFRFAARCAAGINFVLCSCPLPRSCVTWQMEGPDLKTGPAEVRDIRSCWAEIVGLLWCNARQTLTWHPVCRMKCCLGRHWRDTRCVFDIVTHKDLLAFDIIQCLPRWTRLWVCAQGHSADDRPLRVCTQGRDDPDVAVSHGHAMQHTIVHSNLCSMFQYCTETPRSLRSTSPVIDSCASAPIRTAVMLYCCVISFTSLLVFLSIKMLSAGAGSSLQVLGKYRWFQSFWCSTHAACKMSMQTPIEILHNFIIFSILGLLHHHNLCLGLT